ncbi:hypothetical protein [Halosimplex sp. J119]
MSHPAYRLGFLILVFGGFVFTAGGDLLTVGGAMMVTGFLIAFGGEALYDGS